MKITLKLSFAAAAALSVLGGLALAGAPAKAKKKDVIWPAEAVKWAEGPVKGVRLANLWGDMMKGGPYGTLLKFDAGLMHPLHWHSQTLKIVVLSGTFVHKPEGGTEAKLGPGSYLLQAAGGHHISGCAAGAECEFFMTSGDKFDMTTADAAPGEKK